MKQMTTTSTTRGEGEVDDWFSGVEVDVNQQSADSGAAVCACARCRAWVPMRLGRMDVDQWGGGK